MMKKTKNAHLELNVSDTPSNNLFSSNCSFFSEKKVIFTYLQPAFNGERNGETLIILVQGLK